MLTFNNTLSSALLNATHKVQWINTLISALGAPRKIVCKRSASAGDVWAIGTTFFDASMTGTLATDESSITDFGDISDVVTQSAADLATGFSVIRISNAAGTSWVQGTLGLAGSGADFTFRVNLAASNAGLGFGAGAMLKAPSRLSDGPLPGGQITQVLLSNTSGSTQAANFVTPMFGMPLKQGDVPAGQYPQFELEDGTPCPVTTYSDTSWPDGSMKFCGAFARIPGSIAGSGSRPIVVKNGGDAPNPSARSLSDLTAADLSVELGGVTNLSGTWVASLNTAITDAQETVVIGDGPAGKVWRIRGDFKQSGSAHGQLVCYWYVLAAQNSSGGLSHLEVLPRVAQPWTNVASPTPTRRVVTCVMKSGASTILTLSGYDLTATLSGNIGIGHYTSFFVCNTDARWNFVQGGGTTSARPTVHVAHETEYVVKTRLVPPYDLTLNPTANSSEDYRPGGGAGYEMNMGQTGERDDIGVLTGWCVRHIYKQTPTDLRVIRAQGLVSGGWRQLQRHSSNGNIIACANPSGSYTGMTMGTTWRTRPGVPFVGANQPADQDNRWASEFEPSHRPAATYYPYLATGEPQFLDLLVEQANGLWLSAIAGGRTMTMTSPMIRTNQSSGGFGERDVTINGTEYRGGGMLFMTTLTRIQAWMSRDTGQAAGIYPDVCPYGSQVQKYLRELMDNSRAAMIAYMNGFGSGFANLGVINFDDRLAEAKPWCHGFLAISICHESCVLPSANGTALRELVSKFWEGLADISDVACIFAYEGNIYNNNDQRVTDPRDLVFGLATSLSFSTATNRATVASGGWSPTNGDTFVILGTKPFSGVSDWQRLYAVNVSGNTMQLSLTLGGSPLTVTSNATLSNIFGRVANFAPILTAEGVLSPTAYISSMRAAILHHAACGDSVADAVSQANARWSAGSISFTALPKNALAATYPV